MRTMTKAKMTMTLLLCFICSIAFSDELKINDNSNENYKYTKKRTIDANFDARSNYKLNLYGSFSDYKIATWNENYVSFHVEITAKSNRENAAEEMLNNINVEFDNMKSTETIEARTTIKTKKTTNISFQIDYYIMIPENLYLTINNSYGDIEIDKLRKDLNLDLDFGSFSIDSLLSNINKLDINYSDVKIKYSNKIEGKIGFSDIRINNSKNVNINMKYGNGKFGDIKKLTATCEFSEISCNYADFVSLDIKYTDTYFEKVNEITIDDSYSDVEIDYLLKKINFTSTYGDIEINKIDNDFKLIDISSRYGDVDLMLNKELNFSYYISTEYGQIDSKYLKDNARVYIYEINNKEKMSGNIEMVEQKINIEVKYGDVDIDFE